MNTHQEIDRRSLALHRIAAERMRSDPMLFDRARERLLRWSSNASPDLKPQLTQWERLMGLGLEICLDIAVEDSAYATALRQSSPLVFVLSHQERFRFLETWRLAEPHDAA
jgi:hypothetical protein